MDRSGFAANELTRDAVLRNLEIIGEAAKHIPPAARATLAIAQRRQRAYFIRVTGISQ